jgi:hypothetical protein
LHWLQFLVAALELPPDPKQRQFWVRMARLQLIYALAGLIVGLACVAGGLGLFLHGVYGSSSWVGNFIGVQSRLADAAPGTVLFVIGLLIVWLTRFSVRVRQPITIQFGRKPGPSARHKVEERRRKAG